MKRWIQWGLAALIVALLAAGVMRAIATRKAQQQALALQTEQKAQAVLELGSSDVVEVRARMLEQTVPVTGTVKAMDTAFVKVRVAGELQGLEVREGDPVKAGQVIGRIEPTEYQARLKQAQDQADAAQAQVSIARRQYENNRALVDQGFISRNSLETSENNLAAARANHQAAVAAVEVARKVMQDAVLRAPISGYVAQRLAQPGERVAVDTRIVEIIGLGRLELEVALNPADAMQVRAGQTARLRVDGAGGNVQGRVERIGPSVQAGNRSVMAYLSLEPVNGLRHGLFMQGDIGTGSRQGLAVPLSAVRTDKPRPYVQWVDDQKVKHQEVEVGGRGEADGEILVFVQGLPPGAKVIAGQAGLLRDGTAVKLLQGR